MKRVLTAALAAWAGWAAAAIPADLVCRDAMKGNLLEDIAATRQIDAVVTRGRLLDGKRLDVMLAEVRDWVAKQ